MLLLPLLLSGALAGAPRPHLDTKELDEHIWGLALGVPGLALGVPSTRAAPAHQDLLEKIRQFSPVSITAPSAAQLPASDQQVLGLLVRAARLLDPIFNRQAMAGYSALREQLSGARPKLTYFAKPKLTYFDIMRGPWDRQDDHRPFAVDYPKPLGAGFYPADLGEAEWEALTQGEKDRLGGLLTMVEREEDGSLVTRNYSQVFSTWLVPARDLLHEAAAATDNESLRRFLLSRGDAFLSNDYYQSDKDWMDLDSRVEITIGPYEVYEDRLAAQKAAFEAFVTVSDPEASEKLSLYKSLLPDMEQNLPIPDSMKSSRGSESPIRVVDLVFTSGEARKSVQTIAFNLPNDERVRKEKGAKKVLLRNSIQAKFSSILQPIAGTLMKAEQMPLLSADAFFLNVLFHELSHSLGPAFVNNDESQGEVREALGATYSGLEEGKADVMGIYNILFMVQKGHIAEDMTNKVLFTYVAGLFRSVRFGVSEAHGKGAALQLNRYLEEGAVQLLPGEGGYQVNFNKLKTSVSDLVRDICTLQHNGDRAAVESVFQQHGELLPAEAASLGRLGTVPVDIRPCYPLAGEDCAARISAFGK